MLAIAVVGEGALAFAALLWAAAAGYSLRMGPVALGLALGLASAAGLAATQYWLLRLAPAHPLVNGLRELYRDVLVPLFADLSLADVLAISVLAGLGEELLFRGAIQQAWGLGVASALFGLCHVGGRATWVLGLWAGVVGLWLGYLASMTGGLLAPIVAHAVYDAMALSYIRWGNELR